MNIFIKDARTLWVAAAIVLGTGTTIGGVHAQQSTDKAEEAGKAISADNRRPSSLSGKKEGEMIAEVPVVVMVPMEVSNDLAMKKGCWAKLYDKRNYQGDSLLLVGPINLRRMIGPFGVNWENKVRSIETGPKTNLTIFDNRDFRDEDKFIDANVKISDLSRKMGFFDNFRSLMLSCI
ncbi:MAG: beta/gamma crystallin domain-containing protein [Nitrosospira sp.]